MPYLELSVFLFVYAGMMLGGIPRLALDRTGVALLGAILLLSFGAVNSREAWDAIDIPTMGLLFGLMVVSAQLRLGGFYSKLTRSIAEVDLTPPYLLGLIMTAAAVLSALLCNDIICLAMTPILIDSCTHRRQNPYPFLLGLACASNIGSAATLIGNPQNMLIGQYLNLSFAVYSLQAFVPVIASLLFTWVFLTLVYKGKWNAPLETAVSDRTSFHGWQSLKGLMILGALVFSFLVLPFPREVLALAAAGLLLMSRKMATRRMLGLVDWHLLVLFAGLFIVNDGIRRAGYVQELLRVFQSIHIDLTQPLPLFISTPILSNLVSNVPAVMLLLHVSDHPSAGLILALTSTLAGNFILVGSIANLIVVEQAQRAGIQISWFTHLKVGVPVTLVSLLITAIWIWSMPFFLS
ncbi:MAG: anion transporter [Candidatus Hydrogenedentes bacterium]|nr:anion transporter [Candidatus Hydrogenedentota bacterium]